MPELPEIIQLKIRILGISPMVWRRVLIPSATTLRELHGVLQVAMGWESIHLYQFDIRAVRYGSFELFAANPDAPLSDFAFHQNETFLYVYDMGDHWEHEVRIEATSDAAPKKTYPACIGGFGACPPEDCGGAPGYLDRRDEADGYDAWKDMGVMVDFLEEVVAADAPNRPVSDFMTDDVETAMERMVARKPFVEGNFSRGAVNKRFRAGDHRDLMRQQLW